MSATTNTVTAPSIHSKLRRAVVVTVAILSVGALVGCGKDDVRDRGAGDARSSEVGFKDKAPEAKVTERTETDTYPVAMKEAFVTRCAEGEGPNLAECGCIIDKFEQEIPLDEFIRESLKASETGSAPDGWLELMIGCYGAADDVGTI